MPLPPAPDPRELQRKIRSLTAKAEHIGEEYAWLFPSAYHRARMETNERTRRKIAGVSGDLSGTLSATDAVRRHIETCADDVDRAFALLRGAEQALAKAQAALDQQPHAVASDPLPPAPPNKAERERLEAARRRRMSRARGEAVQRGSVKVWTEREGVQVVEELAPSGVAPWAGEEAMG